jgi:hypothetical protein
MKGGRFMDSGTELSDVVIIHDAQGTYYAIPQDTFERWRVPEHLRDAAARLVGEPKVLGFAIAFLQATRFSGSQLTSIGTQTQRALAEAQDAEARVADLLSDYKCLLHELRK